MAKKSISQFTSATTVNPGDLLMISQLSGNAYVTRSAAISSIGGGAGGGLTSAEVSAIVEWKMPGDPTKSIYGFVSQDELSTVIGDIENALSIINYGGGNAS